MKNDRLMELAGVQLNEGAGVVAAAFDTGDGTFLGMIGPFASEKAADDFIKNNKIQGVRIEREIPQSPEAFIKDWKD